MLSIHNMFKHVIEKHDWERDILSVSRANVRSSRGNAYGNTTYLVFMGHVRWSSDISCENMIKSFYKQTYGHIQIRGWMTTTGQCPFGRKACGCFDGLMPNSTVFNRKWGPLHFHTINRIRFFYINEQKDGRTDGRGTVGRTDGRMYLCTYAF